MIIQTIADLKKVLAVYPESLPVKFVSHESGGYWPSGRGAMEIGTDESVGMFVELDKDRDFEEKPQTKCLQIGLFLVKPNV